MGDGIVKLAGEVVSFFGDGEFFHVGGGGFELGVCVVEFLEEELAFLAGMGFTGEGEGVGDEKEHPAEVGQSDKQRHPEGVGEDADQGEAEGSKAR